MRVMVPMEAKPLLVARKAETVHAKIEKILTKINKAIDQDDGFNA